MQRCLKEHHRISHVHLCFTLLLVEQRQIFILKSKIGAKIRVKRLEEWTGGEIDLNT